MNRLKAPLAFILLLFSLTCSDMATQVSDPEGINPDETGDDGDGSTEDTTPPFITDFTLTSGDPATSPTITFTLEGTDDVGITGWMVNESSTAPDASDSDWLDTKPDSYLLSGGAGTYIVYAWAKDAAGNVSDPASIGLTYTPDDVVDPVLTDFTLTSSSPTTDPVVTFTLDGTDAFGITAWMITESASPPLANDGGWLTTKPISYTLTGFGLHTLYAWAKDAAGNVSDSLSFTVQYNMPLGVWDSTNWDQCLWQ